MTISINIIGNKGIIISMDSRRTNYDKDGNFTGYDDNGKKPFILKNHTAIAFAGNLISNSKKVTRIVNEINMLQFINKIGFIDTTELVYGKSIVKFNDFETDTVVGGYIGSEGTLFTIKLHGDGHTDYAYVHGAGSFRMKGCGDAEAVKIMKSKCRMDTAVSNDEFANYLSKKDDNYLIQLSEETIKELIAIYQEKDFDKRFIGGNISTIYITQKKAVWLKKFGDSPKEFLQIVPINISNLLGF